MPAEQLPDLKLTEEKVEEISNWLYTQLTAMQQDRAEWLQLWKDIEEYYDKTSLDEKIDFPFEGAAHLMIPLMPTFVETIKAKVANTIWAPADPFATSTQNKYFMPFLKPMRNFITWAVDNELDLEEVLDMVLSDDLQLGSAVVKILYRVEEESRHEYDAATKTWTEIPEVIANHPEIIPIPIEDFYFQLQARSLEESKIKAHRYRRTWNDLLRGQANGKYKNVDRIEAWVTKTQEEHDRETVEGTEVFIRELEEYELFEVWFEYPLTEGALPTKMVWQFHLESRIPIRMQYNWYPLTMDPFELLVYERRRHRVLGTGVGQMVLPFQKEVSTMHNQRIDAGTVKNAPMFKYKADSSIPGQIKFTVGGGIPVDDMDDIDVLFSGNPYDSTIEDEKQTLSLLRERVGMQDFMAQDVIANAQSTSVLAAMSESTRRFDTTIRRVRKFLARVMIKVMLLYQKYYPEGKTVLVQGEDGMLVEQAFKFPEKWITEGLVIDVTATTSTTSKELERQTKLSLFGMVTQAYGQITQYLLQAENPQLPLITRLAMLQIVDSLSTFVLDILDDFNLSKAREFATSITAIQDYAREQLRALVNQGPGAAPGMGPVFGAPGASPGGTGQAPPGGPQGGTGGGPSPVAVAG